LNVEKVCKSIYAGLPSNSADDRQPVRNPNDLFLGKAKKNRKKKSDMGRKSAETNHEFSKVISITTRSYFKI